MKDKMGFWMVLALVFLAEIPCIIRTVAFQLRNDGIWSVVWGTMAGSALALAVGILTARLATRALPPWILEYAENFSAALLIGLGIYLLLRHEH